MDGRHGNEDGGNSRVDLYKNEAGGGYRDEGPDESGIRNGRSPWLEVWLHPRQVTRWFLDSANPLRGALALALVSGVLNAFNSASNGNWGDVYSTGGLIARAIVIGLIGGLIGYYVGSFLIKWVGSWFGGVGSMSDMQVVVGRISGMTSIVLGLLLIPELLIAGRELFTEQTPYLDAHPLRSLLLAAVLFVEFALSVWIFVILLHAIGEAHGFSAWKALLVESILIVAVVVVVFVVVFAMLGAAGPSPGF
ncbi:Yip1 family protein [Saccharibacillus alkalitolerans]|uniref:YIP1 family protein n=1 Tax=Saccharibacillus alkalitolerans TaxID=2705290 RepID=A0ABX0F514_9BACL|nr:Yip1 family protein [Saccharibacillus alkalitolerans]NGZ75560.1 YIP1 family protein [Saccharibacillus alkalitolerans]